jgi:hypothetical protein
MFLWDLPFKVSVDECPCASRCFPVFSSAMPVRPTE